MRDDTASKKKRRVEIFIKWIKSNLDISIEKQKILAGMGLKLGREIEILYQLYFALEKQMSVEETEVSLNWKSEKSCLVMEGGTVELENEKMQALFEVMIEIFEDILPIGSVITFKKEMLEEFEASDVIADARFVIVDRYLRKRGTECYIPYCGVPYPFGSLADSKKIYFTPLAVHEVLHRGYEDELEEAYVCTMKSQIIEQKLKSFTFSEDEQEAIGSEGEVYDKIRNQYANHKL